MLHDNQQIADLTIGRAADMAAANYVVSLWGKQRRQYARRYWLYLTRDMARPSLDECFGALWIEQRLNMIQRFYYPWHNLQD